ncbi:MAG: sulfur carrier protein ThiS [Nitrospinota bacterium]
MNIRLNGKLYEIKEEANIKTLLDELNINSKAIAVMVNGVIIKARMHELTILSDSDQVEIVMPLQGGKF